MTSWMIRETAPSSSMQSIVWQKQGSDINTAFIKKYGRNAFSLGTMGLCGCTSMWIISRSGVYGTHYWESISFSPDNIVSLITA